MILPRYVSDWSGRPFARISRHATASVMRKVGKAVAGGDERLDIAAHRRAEVFELADERIIAHHLRYSALVHET